MKYSEAKKQIKALSSDYTIVMSDSDFNIWYAGSANFVAYVSGLVFEPLIVGTSSK